MASAVEVESVRVEWDPAAALLHATIREGPPLSASAAERVVQALRDWTDDRPHFDIIIGVHADPGEESAWHTQLGYWIATATAKPRIAFYGPSVDTERAQAFALASGLDVRFFDEEREARGWLGATGHRSTP